MDKFVGLPKPQTLILQNLEQADLRASRLRGSFMSGSPVQLDQSDGYLLCLQRRTVPAAHYWVDGQPVPLPSMPGGQFLLMDMNREHRSISFGEVDCVSTYVSRKALQSFGEEHDRSSLSELRTAVGRPLDDEVIRHLSETLIPAFDRPEASNRLFADYVVLALLARLTASYGQHSALPPLRGKLAPWQEKRAKEVLAANLNGNVSLEELAQACGLSRAHFARAFKSTTGVTPMRWLLTLRIQRARNLLLNSGLSLDEIAYQCGFADQSHFTRAFGKHTGCAPGTWRRMHRFF